MSVSANLCIRTPRQMVRAIPNCRATYVGTSTLDQNFAYVLLFEKEHILKESYSYGLWNSCSLGYFSMWYYILYVHYTSRRTVLVYYAPTRPCIV